MLEYFKRFVKPKNDTLSEMLGVKKIAVKQDSTVESVPVSIGLSSPSGVTVFVRSDRIQFYKALGLSLRGQNEN